MHALTSNALSEAPGWRRVSAIADLAEIFEPGVQVCSWRRAVDPQVTAYLDGAAARGTGQSIETLAPDQRAVLDDLPAGEGREALLDDVTSLAEILHQLGDCPLVGLRCTRVERAMCPRWHVDRVPLRMLCTYRGPGTEWLADQRIDRADLADPGIVGGAGRRADTGELVLLKGSLWQDNGGLGAVHRSPDVQPGAGQRVIVTLDPLWLD